jgi:alkylation response protein AidB-like acyl-CoA dehydrogenase
LVLKATGWRVATTTLMNERIAIAGSDQGRGSSPIELVLGHWRRSRDGMDEARRAVLRQQVAGLLIRAEVLRLTLQRANARATAGVPGPEGSVGKLAVAHLHQAYYECALTLQGAARHAARDRLPDAAPGTSRE